MEANAYLKTNSITPGQTIPLIVGATALGMGFMFAFIWLGLPMWLTVGLFIGIIFFSIYSFVYTAQYWIYNDRLVEKLDPKLSFMPFLKPQQNTYLWADLDSYLADSTLTRYYGERPYLRLDFINPKRRVQIGAGNEKYEKENFSVFAAAFSALLAADAPATTTIQSEPAPPKPTATVVESAIPTPTPAPAKPIHAKAQKSFYEGIWGKLLAVVFLLFTAVLLAIKFFPEAFGIQELSGTANWKLFAVVVPGTLYMMNRAFFSRKK